MSSTVVLNLRPKPEGDALNVQLLAAGFETQHIPIFDISPMHSNDSDDEQGLSKGLSKGLPKDLPKKDAHYDAIIFVSQNAVRYGMPVLAERGVLTKRLFAVGPATGALLEALAQQQPSYMQTPVVYPKPDAAHSEGFLQLPELQALGATSRVLIVRGVSGRELIKETLEQQGVDVAYYDAYQRQLAQAAKTAIPAFWESYKSRIDSVVVIISSGEALKNLIPLTPKFFYDKCRLLVSSERLAVFARQQGFSWVECAMGATSQQLISALVKDL